MRRRAVRLIASIAVLGSFAATGPAPAQQAPSAQPPHAWLFGTWTGGLFPAPRGLNAEACFGQPVVIFTRDLVMRATLTDLTYTQREIETVRSSPEGAEFRFTSAGVPGGADALLGLPSPAALRGFGCDDKNVLHVQRRGENEIVFPGCADFPNPLVRCP